MDKLEQFITQSKINHLKRLGLCPNDDDEYQKLLHQIEQKKQESEKEQKQSSRIYNILLEINTLDLLHEGQSLQDLEFKRDQMNKQLTDITSCNPTRFGKQLVINTRYILRQKINEISGIINELDKENKIFHKYISNLVIIDRDYFEDEESVEKNDVERLKVENKEAEDQFFSIIKNVGNATIYNDNDTENIDINLYDFFKNDYTSPDWNRYHKFDLEIEQLEEKKKNYTNEYGHWYLNSKKIDISDEEYEELCKISPPFLFRIEECIQEVYNKGYNEGHEDGYNEGYNNGYDDGYRMGD